MPGSIVQSGLVIFECCVGRAAVPEQKLDSPGIVAYRYADGTTGSVGTEASKKRRLLLENSLRQGLIAYFDGLNET